MIEKIIVTADEYPPENFWAEYLPDESLISTEVMAEYPHIFSLDHSPDDGTVLTINVRNGVARYAIDWDERGFWHAIFLSWRSSLV